MLFAVCCLLFGDWWLHAVVVCVVLWCCALIVVYCLSRFAWWLSCVVCCVLRAVR